MVKKCLSCKTLFKREDGLGDKYCSLDCQKAARVKFGAIMDGLKVEKRPWGEIVKGDFLDKE